MAPRRRWHFGNCSIGALDQAQQLTEHHPIAPVALTTERIDRSHEQWIAKTIDHNAGRLSEIA
jgi:hypothetical protein